MGKVKYQVFISATYTDLIEERKKVWNALLMADCIPSGMENFVATDDEQFNVIKKIIDMCDYYILILGKRYGSVNSETGISYTEMEYNYAIDKGIPVLVFAMDDSVEVDDDKIEKDEINKLKLSEFKSKAMRNRLACIWRDQTDLVANLIIAIMQVKEEIKRPGWYRGDDEEKERLQKDIDYLRKENEELRNKLLGINMDSNELGSEFYGKEIKLHYTEKIHYFTSTTVANRKKVQTTLDELFKFISPRITGIKKVSEFREVLSSFQEGYYVDEQDALLVRNKFEQLGLIQIYIGRDDIQIMKLTYLGTDIMNKLK